MTSEVTGNCQEPKSQHVSRLLSKKRQPFKAHVLNRSLMTFSVAVNETRHQRQTDRHALESTASLCRVPLLALHLQLHGAHDLISTLCLSFFDFTVVLVPCSVFVFFLFFSLSHAESFLCLENGFALMFYLCCMFSSLSA